MNTLHESALNDQLPEALQQRISNKFSSAGYLQMTLDSIDLLHQPRFEQEYKLIQKDFAEIWMPKVNDLDEVTNNLELIESLKKHDFDDVTSVLLSDWKDRVLKIVFGGKIKHQERVMSTDRETWEEYYSHLLRVQYARDLVNIQVVKTWVAFTTDRVLWEFTPEEIITPEFTPVIQAKLSDYISGIQEKVWSLDVSKLAAIKTQLSA